MAKYYKTTNARSTGISGLNAHLVLVLSTDDADVGRYETRIPLTLFHPDPAVMFAAVKVAEWSKASELLLQLEKVVKSVDTHRPRAKQPAAAVAGLRAMRCDLFTSYLTDGQTYEAYLLLTGLYEALDKFRGDDLRIELDDVYFEDDDGVCYNVEAA